MTDQDQRQPAHEPQAESQSMAEQTVAQPHQSGQEGEMPQEVRDVLPELQGEIDEDQVLDAQEDDSLDLSDDTEARDTEWDAASADDEDVEYVDVDDLLAVMGDLREMLEAQSKEIRGLRREMRDLRDAVGSGRPGGAPRRDFGGRDGGFRPREDRGGRDFGGRDGGFRPREDRGSRDFGGRDGGFRPREDRGSRDFGGRDGGDTSSFRPRARADRGWGNRSGDES